MEKKIHIPPALRKYIYEFKEDECKYITKSGKRCILGDIYKHRETGKIKDCSKFCSVYLNENCKTELFNIINTLLYDEIKTDTDIKAIRHRVKIQVGGDRYPDMISFNFKKKNNSIQELHWEVGNDEEYFYHFDMDKEKDRNSLINKIKKYCGIVCDKIRPNKISFYIDLIKNVGNITSIGEIRNWKNYYGSTYIKEINLK